MEWELLHGVRSFALTNDIGGDELRKLSDYVVEVVERAGVKHVFMLTGGACMHLTDSFGRSRGLDYVCCLHEQACAFAAEAYAEYTGGLGVGVVTAGPGGTNAITGVAAAWLESASCLIISGQAKRSDLIGTSGVRSMGTQELDIVSVVGPITKYAVQITEPESIRYELEKAIHLATHGRRGPVWVDIPLDVQNAVIDETRLKGFTPDVVESSTDASRLSRQVSQAIALLNASRRPVLFLGNGVRGAEARGLVHRLIDTLKIPVLVTWKAIDLVPETNAFLAGRPGTIGQRAANFVQQTSDCMLVAGARLDLPQTAFNHEHFAPAARKIMVDVDPAELRKMKMAVDVPICADATDFIAEILRQSDRLIRRDRSQWVARTREWNRKYPVVLSEYWTESGPAVNYYVLVDVLSDVLTADDVIVPGSSGPCSDILMQVFRVKPGQRVVNAPGLGAMGTGLPGSIGACIASGRKRTVCVNGDGGFQLNIQELETVRRLQLPIKFFVLCNGGYASIMATQRNYFDGRYTASEPSSHLTLPDIIRVAEAYGIPTARLEDHRNIQEYVRRFLGQEGPGLCAVTVSPEQATAPRVTSMIRDDGTIVSRPMEDMWPFLSREELQANMATDPCKDEELAEEPVHAGN
jgi:acetolactate synthase-1/2/3 large subunit